MKIRSKTKQVKQLKLFPSIGFKSTGKKRVWNLALSIYAIDHLSSFTNSKPSLNTMWKNIGSLDAKIFLSWLCSICAEEPDFFLCLAFSDTKPNLYACHMLK